MNDSFTRVKNLSPEKRRLLELWNSKKMEILPIQKIGRGTPLPLSFAQQRLWLNEQINSNSVAYNKPCILRLQGELKVSALVAALEELVRRHEVLRTHFEVVDGQPMQVIDAPGALLVPLRDLSMMDAGEREAEAMRLAGKELEGKFDLARGPLLRANLLRLAERDHILLITMHHIVSDGWSMGIIMRELATLYVAYKEGRPSPLQELELQYADYAAWQRNWLQGTVLERLLGYWKNQLRQVPALDMPADYTRPPVPSSKAARVTVQLPLVLTDQMVRFSQKHGVTVFMTLLAGFQILLAKYCRQDDVAIGVDIANRKRLQLESLIGFFVNVLVLRCRLTAGSTFTQFVEQVRRTLLQAYEHQDLPFERLIQELAPERSLGQTPLVQAVLVFQNTPEVKGIELPALKVSSRDIGHGDVKFDLSLSLTPDPEGICGVLEYSTDLFAGERMERLSGHFVTLMEHAMSDPECLVDQISLLSANERRQLLLDWNKTEVVYPRTFIHEAFEQQAEATPAAVAVKFNGRYLTYAALDHRANQVARYLRKLGVRPEVRVGICMERSLELIVGLLGILKAGGAYVPMDPEYPAERLAFMLQDSESRILLTRQQLISGLPRMDFQIIDLDAEWAEIAAQSTNSLDLKIAPDNLAYAIYTSGSTGTPKGAMNTHAAISNRLIWMQEEYRLNESDIVLQKTSISFDVSVWELFWPLMTGAALVLANPEGHRDSDYLINLIVNEQVTTLHFVPSMLRVFLQHPKVNRCTSLKRVLASGEALSPDLVSKHNICLRSSLHNLYGPTEAAIDVTAWACPKQGSPHVVSIGRPIANVQIYVLGPELQPVPAGVAGELYIGGIGLARGYLKRPAMTAERFLPDPFSDQQGQRLYSTGDKARWSFDGNLEFLVRMDEQVKIRGNRIEPGEIEATLMRHEAVKQVVVIVREDQPGDKKLVAYFVREESVPEPGAADLRSYMRRYLPEYMVPGMIVEMKKLPQTPSGKVDRKALPLPTSPETNHNNFEEPVTAAERILASIWQRVLHVSRISRHDNFFELGGDSLLCFKVVTQAIQAGIDITVPQMFQHQTLAGLAAAIPLSRLGLQEEPVEGYVPLTAIQHWFFEQGLQETHLYDQALWLETRKGLAVERLRLAMEAVLSHHDAVRLRFSWLGKEWQQQYANERTPSFKHLDLKGKSEPEQREVMEQEFAAMRSNLDLEHGPLVRAAFFELGEKSPGRLLWMAHHLVVDGISWRVLLEDLHIACQQLESGEMVVLPPKTISLQGWTEHLSSWISAGGLGNEERYWLQLEERQPKPFPRDYDDGDSTAGVMDVIVNELGQKETVMLLRQASQRLKVEVQPVLLAALAKTLTQWSGEQGVLVEMEGHGREPLLGNIDISRTMGWFTTLFPIWLPWQQTLPLEESVLRVKEVLAAVPRHGIGYGLLRYMAPDKKLQQRFRKLPQPEILFNYLGRLDETLPEASLFRPLSMENGKSIQQKEKRSHPLTVGAIIWREKLVLTWNYARELYRQTTIERLSTGFIENLQAILKLCHAGNLPSMEFDLPTGFAGQDMSKLLSKVGAYRGPKIN